MPPEQQTVLTIFFGPMGAQLIQDGIDFFKFLITLVEDLVPFFQGRPKDQATQQSAEAATKSKNPAFRLYGVQLVRMMKEWGIVTSDSNPGRRSILGSAYKQAVDNGISMGFSRKDMQGGLDWILSRDGQAGNNPPPIIGQFPTTQPVLWGTQAIQDTIVKAQGIATSKGLTLGDWDRYVEKYTWHHAPLSSLFHVMILKQGDVPPLKCSKGYEWNYSVEECTPKPSHQNCPTGFQYNPVTGFCDPLTPPGPQSCPEGTTWSPEWNACLPNPVNGTCPPGYLFNAQTGNCDPNVPPPPPACPLGQQWNEQYQVCAPTPQNGTCPVGYGYNDATQQCDPLGPPPGPQDECCTQTLAQLNTIGQQVAQIAADMTAGGVSTGFANVVAALGDVTTELTNILDTLNAIANQPETPATDLSGLISALNALGECICELPAIAQSTRDTLDSRLAAIEEALAPAAPVDISQVVAELKRRNDDLQVPDDWKTQLINSGAVPSDLVPLLQSTTWETAIAGAAHGLGWALGWGLSEATAVTERIFDWLIKPAIGIIWKLFSETIAGFNLGAGDAPNQIATAATAIFKALDSTFTTIFGGLAVKVLDGYESGIAGLDLTSDAGITTALQKFMGRALELGTTAHLVAVLPELAYFTKQLGLNATAALLAELAGFHEVMIQAHRPFMTATIGRPSTYSVNRKFPTTLPPAAIGATWAARRKISDSDADYLLSSGGFVSRWKTPMLAAAYRPISARALTTLIADTPFPLDTMREILQDNGMSDAHVNFMLDSLEFNSLKNVRNSYVTEAIRAYEGGVMPDSELDSILDSVKWSPDAKQLVKNRALLARRLTLAKETEKNIIPELAAGLIDQPTAHNALTAAGVESWYADLVVTLGETKASLGAARKAATQEAKIAAQRQREATRAAVANFHTGALDAVGLAAALVLDGLDPSIVASVVAVETAKRAGSLRLVFGQLLNPNDAKILDERVGAIEQQVKDQLLGFEAARSQLQGLKVPDTQINALLARWAATLKKSPGADILLDPITGRPV